MTDPELTASAATGELLPQEICGEVLLEKYAKGNEQTICDVRMRVARALAAMESEEKRLFWETKFLEAQEHSFVPSGLFDQISRYYLYGSRYLPEGKFRMFRAIAPIVLLRLMLLFGYVGRLSSRQYCARNSLEPSTLLNFLRPCVRAPPSLLLVVRKFLAAPISAYLTFSTASRIISSIDPPEYSP